MVSLYISVCHAELNAVLNTYNNDMKNCTIYVGLFPCNECAKVIIQAGIKKIIYYSDKQKKKDTNEAAKMMFDAAEVEYKCVNGYLQCFTTFIDWVFLIDI